MLLLEPNQPSKPSSGFLKALLPVALIIWASLLLFSRPHLLTMVRTGDISPLWLFVGPAILLILFSSFVTWRFFSKTSNNTLADWLPVVFGLAFIGNLLLDSFQEFRVRTLRSPLDITTLQELYKNSDARIRALVLLATPRNNINLSAISSLIHRGLLDKDPLVQEAAKMVIEENLGIRLKNGDEGLDQAQELIREALPYALLIKKGVP